MQHLLQGAVGVLEPPRIGRGDRRVTRAVSDRLKNLVAVSAGLLGARRGRDRGRVGERGHVGELAGARMKALPQRGEDLHAVERERLDPGLGELRLRELGLPPAVRRGTLMRAPRDPPARRERSRDGTAW